MSKTSQRKRTARQQAYADFRRGKVNLKLWQNSYYYIRYTKALDRVLERGRPIVDADRPPNLAAPMIARGDL